METFGNTPESTQHISKFHQSDAEKLNFDDEYAQYLREASVHGLAQIKHSVLAYFPWNFGEVISDNKVLAALRGTLFL